MPTVIAHYSWSSAFILPKSVVLNDGDGFDDRVPGSWYIKWNTLHYIDANGKAMTIEGGEDEPSMKRPDDTDFDEDDHLDDDAEFNPQPDSDEEDDDDEQSDSDEESDSD
jgi:hypothetical protein